MAFRIACINKDAGNHENSYVALSHLNWIDDQTQQTGRSTLVQMYDFVNGGGDAFVQVGNSRAQLIAEVSPRGTKFVKTLADDTQADNLLKLPECR